MLKAFVDDSGSGGDSPWVVLAGYIGTVPDWDTFDSEWKAVLDAHPHIEYFKSSEAESLKGQFLGLTREEANVKIDNLISVISGHARQAVEVRVRQSNYDKILKGFIPKVFDHPYYVLFLGFITASAFLERHYGLQEPIEFIFDTQQQFEKPSMSYYEVLSGWNKLSGLIVNVLYRDEKVFLPLQAADLLAWQVRRAFSVPSEQKRRHLAMARRCSGAWPPCSVIIDRDLLETTKQQMLSAARKRIEEYGIPVR